MTGPGPCVRCGHDPYATVSHRWVLTINREVHSLNAHRVNAGATRWAYKRDRDAWQWELKVARINERIPIAVAKRRVTLVRVMGKGQREFDIDNLVGGAKCAVDAMVREGLLMGDARDQVELVYEQKRAEKPGVIVIIEEFEVRVHPTPSTATVGEGDNHGQD